MSLQTTIRQRLEAEFEPEELILVNDSDKHHVPPGSETHWNVTIVSGAFEGLSRVARHRAVYKVLDEQLRNAIHALSVRAVTPREWAARPQANQTPDCAGARSAD
ncbi:MAG: BolA family transcriptional regulator [Candidatus Dadabacteria bacterium]|nr:MAG: BolA family transcriptional regulator [Candidatus Dadabacteria bacterium]